MEGSLFGNPNSGLWQGTSVLSVNVWFATSTELFLSDEFVVDVKKLGHASSYLHRGDKLKDAT